MARQRFIKPAFFQHAELYDAEVASGLPLRLAFAGLWCQCDRRGIFRVKHRELKMALLPYDNVDITVILQCLHGAGFVVLYVVDGKQYGIIPGFERHQRCHPTEMPSLDPAPPTNRSLTVTQPVEQHYPCPYPEGDGVTDTLPNCSLTVISSPPNSANADTDTTALEAETGAAWPAWHRELDAMASGMPGHHAMTPDQLARTIRDWLARDRKRWPDSTLITFRAFAKRIKQEPVPTEPVEYVTDALGQSRPCRKLGPGHWVTLDEPTEEIHA